MERMDAPQSLVTLLDMLSKRGKEETEEQIESETGPEIVQNGVAH